MTQRTKSIHTTPKVLITRKTPGSFKVCPLCTTLNVKENHACCCCGWSGRFEEDSHQVTVRMWQMVDDSPELQLLLLKELRTPWWKSCIRWLKSHFRRRLDIRA